ncbi:MAG: site-specific integrase [Opitutales bacterium]|nr:site-specific integrase [Opitutales bacterium]
MYDKHGIRKYLSAAERRRFYESAVAETDLGKKIFCLTIYFTGCRISEVLELRVDKIDFDNEIIVVRTLKQRENGDRPPSYRYCLVPRELLQLYRDLIKGKNLDDRLFDFSVSTGYRAVKTHMEIIGLSGARATPRGLRHTFAVSHVLKHVPLPIIQKWMGHKDLQSTAVYLNIVSEEERYYAQQIWPKNAV